MVPAGPAGKVRVRVGDLAGRLRLALRALPDPLSQVPKPVPARGLARARLRGVRGWAGPVDHRVLAVPLLHRLTPTVARLTPQRWRPMPPVQRPVAVARRRVATREVQEALARLAVLRRRAAQEVRVVPVVQPAAEILSRSGPACLRA